MSSTQEGSSANTSMSKKVPASRRSWTILEESALLAAFQDLVVQRQKSENGFKPGYLKQLEDVLIEKIPSTDLRINPHIVSKLSTWKKQYYSLSSILSRSGVGFNDRGNHMIDCEDEQWQQIVKMDPHARGMRKKQWPYYELWKEVFGTDRATGENAEDIHEAFIDIQGNTPPPVPDFEINENMQSSFENDFTDASNDVGSQSTKNDTPVPKNTRSKKKARFNEELKGVCELLTEMNESTNVRLDKLTRGLGLDYDMSKARQETFTQLGEIPGLSTKHRFKLCELVAFKVERLDVWRAMDHDARAQYAEHLLEEMGW